MRKFLFLLILCFELLAKTVSAQNTCAAPTVIASLPYTSATLTTCGTVDNYAAGTLFDSNYGGGEDYVFSLTVASGGTSTLTLGGAATWKIASVHSACGPTSANAIGGVTTSSGSTGSGTITFPSAGTYYIIVDTWPTPTCGAFTLALTALAGAPSAPANDNCSGAITMTVNPNGSTTSTVTANNINATNSNVTPSGACTSNSGTPDKDIWYKFVAPASGGVILTGTYVSGTSSDVYYQIFSGACGSTMTSLLCTDTDTGGTVTGLTSGSTYYIRYYNYFSTDNATYTLSVQATAAAPTTPANDEPCGAIALTVGTACSSYATYTNASATATSGVTAPGCASYSGGDVWFKAVVPASGRLIVDTQTGGMTDSGMAFYTATGGSCPGTAPTLTLVECDDDDSPNGAMSFIDKTGLTPGATIYIRMWEYSNDNNGTFGICAYAAPTTPANDEPCGAIALTVGTAVCGSYATYTNAGATATSGVTAPGCASYSGGDVWFKAVVPASGRLIVDTQTGGMTDSGMAFYTATGGSCPGTAPTLTLVECDDDDSPNSGMSFIDKTGLTPGATVYIRMWEFGNDNNGTFGICAYTINPPSYPIGSTTCTTLNKLCSISGSTLSFGATTGAADASVTNPGNNYSCLSTTPRPTWFYVELQTSGSIDLTLQGYDDTNAVVDNDFALWGPFANVAAAQAACNTYGAPIDCSYSAGGGSESINIPLTGTAGQVYVLLVTAYSTSSSSFTLLQEATSTGSTSCAGVAGVCDISNVTLANNSACNGNGTTANSTDDYYTTDVTITFANKPATGNLDLVGTGIHSGTYSVAVASTSTATTHTFTGVKIKANGSSQSITAQFSTLTGCNFVKSGIAGVNSCSCAAGVMTLTGSTP